MTEYEVIIDFESCHLVVEADSPEEAEEKGLKKYIDMKAKDMTFPECWVGEVNEVDNNPNEMPPKKQGVGE